MGNGQPEWIAYVALGISIIVAILGYFIKPSFVPVLAVDKLKDTIAELRLENNQLRARVSTLEVQLESLRGEARWWQEEFRHLRENQVRDRQTKN